MGKRAYKKIKVLHGLYAPAGQSYLIAKALRQQKLRAYSLNLNDNPFGYPGIYLNLAGTFTNAERVKKIRKFILDTSLRYFDYFHFYGLRTFGNINQLEQDLRLLKNRGKKIIFNFEGTDIRQQQIAANYRYYSPPSSEYDLEREEAKRDRFEIVKKYADAYIAGSPDLLEYAPGAQFIRATYDAWLIDKIKKNSTPSSEKIKIVHIPSVRGAKGTETVLEVMKKITAKHNNVDFSFIEGSSHKKSLEAINSSNIVIDQLRMGAHGVLAQEAMALGKVVICYLREDLLSYYPECPIINANPDNFETKIEELITHPEIIKEAGERGETYVRKYHHPSVIAAQLIDLYDQMYRG